MSIADEIAIFAGKTAVILGFIIFGMSLFCMCGGKKTSNAKNYFKFKKYNPGTNTKSEEVVLSADKPRALVYNLDVNKSKELTKFIQFVIATCQNSQDTIVFRINSNGGAANAFTYAHATMMRLKQRGIKTIALIDEAALSGGYMVACACSEIIASPSAEIGSIGVILQTINIRNLLERFGIKPIYLTTTAHKGLGGLFDEITPEREAALRTEIDYTFEHFKQIVLAARPDVRPEEVFNARHWYVSSAPVGLVDKIQTGDDYLLELMATHNIYTICVDDTRGYTEKIMEKFDLRNHLTKQFAVPVWSNAV